MENGKRLKNRRLLIIGCMIAGLLAGMASSAFAKGNQVFFRGGGAFLSEDRGNQVFTDVNGALKAPSIMKIAGFTSEAGLNSSCRTTCGDLCRKPPYWVRSEWSTDGSTRIESCRQLPALFSGLTNQMGFQSQPEREGATHDAERQRLAQDQVQ